MPENKTPRPARWQRYMAPGVVQIAVLMLLAPSSPVSGFSQDSHYYLTYLGALDTCFDWEEAHIIASANLRVDGQSTTKAEANILKKHSKIAWHAFGHSQERLTDLWYQAVDEQGPELRLVYLGQFLHFLQDWESHAGFPTGIGHARATFVGKDPDSWARSLARTERMLRSVGDHLLQFCSVLDRLPDGMDDSDYLLPGLTRRLLADHVLEDVVALSNPKWKARRTGGFSKSGKRVLRQNAIRLEKYIETHIKPMPEKNVPADFTAGDPDRGLPPTLHLQYDREGSVVGVEDDFDEAGTRGDPSDEIGPEISLTIRQASPSKNGWKVRVELRNEGPTSSREGAVTIMVIDPMAREVLGEICEPVEALEPGTLLRVDAEVATTRAVETVMIEAFIDVEDLDTQDNEAWYMTADDLAELDKHLEDLWAEQAEDEDFGDEDLRRVRDPKAWLTDHDELCIVTTVRLFDDDPTSELDPPTYSLMSSAGELLPLDDGVLFNIELWSMTVMDRNQRPAEKSWACFDLKKGLCTEETTDFDPTTLRIVLGLQEIKKVESVSLETAVFEPIHSLCN